MTIFVLDASVTGCWLLPDENDPRADIAWTQYLEHRAVVPQHWHVEVLNALYQAERNGRITPARTEELIGEQDAINVFTDTQPDKHAALLPARKHNLSFYDALYLELTKRLNLQLATLETRRLNIAASIEGVLMGNE